MPRINSILWIKMLSFVIKLWIRYFLLQLFSQKAINYSWTGGCIGARPGAPQQTLLSVLALPWKRKKSHSCPHCSNMPAKGQHLDSYFQIAVSAITSCIFHFKYSRTSVSVYLNICLLLLAFQHFINCLISLLSTDSELGKERHLTWICRAAARCRALHL